MSFAYRFVFKHLLPIFRFGAQLPFLREYRAMVKVAFRQKTITKHVLVCVCVAHMHTVQTSSMSEEIDGKSFRNLSRKFSSLLSLLDLFLSWLGFLISLLISLFV